MQIHNEKRDGQNRTWCKAFPIDLDVWDAVIEDMVEVMPSQKTWHAELEYLENSAEGKMEAKPDWVPLKKWKIRLLYNSGYYIKKKEQMESSR